MSKPLVSDVNWCNLYCRHNHRSRKEEGPGYLTDRSYCSLKTGIGLPKENCGDLLEAPQRLAPVGSWERIHLVCLERPASS